MFMALFAFGKLSGIFSKKWSDFHENPKIVNLFQFGLCGQAMINRKALVFSFI